MHGDAAGQLHFDFIFRGSRAFLTCSCVSAINWFKEIRRSWRRRWWWWWWWSDTMGLDRPAASPFNYRTAGRAEDRLLRHARNRRGPRTPARKVKGMNGWESNGSFGRCQVG